MPYLKHPIPSLPALGALFALLLLQTPWAQAETSIRGIYALQDDERPVPESVLENSNVDGVALRYHWNRLEPSDGGFDWSPLDNEIARARAHGKKVSIGVTAGITTPSWVYSAGAMAFQFTWDKPWGFPMCSRQRMPVPWDPVFLSKWEDFVRALGRRYGPNPALVYVKMSGINAATQEVLLPHAGAPRTAAAPGPDRSGISVVQLWTGHRHMRAPRRGENECPDADDITNWQRVGYTRSKLRRAWESIVTTYIQAFPDKKLGLEIGPRGFPPIDDDGRLIEGRDADLEAAPMLMAIGNRISGSRFVAQCDGLNAVRGCWKDLQRMAGGAQLGLQMGWSVSGDQRCRMNKGISPCEPGSTLRAAIDHGLAVGATFLEIYIADLENPVLQSIIADAHARLLAHAAPL